MIDYQLKRSKRKTIGIKITRDGAVVVTAPSHLRKAQIEAVVNRKWQTFK